MREWEEERPKGRVQKKMKYVSDRADPPHPPPPWNEVFFF